ncbi:MAG: glycoside hydrolase family 18 protein [Sediminibacterium sp.]|jgi:chitinase
MKLRICNTRYLPVVLFMLFVVACSKKDQVISPAVPPVVTSPVGNAISPPAPFGFYVVGYFPSYRDPALVTDQKFRMCNVINYAFANVTPTGGLTVANPSVLSTVVSKAKLNNAKIFISISGLAADFKNMATTSSGRNSFVKSIMQVVRTYGLDGVDVDWEFPRTDDGTDITFTAFMKELSDSCHTGAKYYLSAAITAGKFAGAVRDAISSTLWTNNTVDFFNIMAYDDFSTTVPFRHHSDLALAQTALNYWISSRGMPASKAVLGIPAYGRPSGITQTGTVLTYNIITSGTGSAFSDSAIVSAGGFSNYTIYYNGLPTVKRKAKLAQSMANGIMMWEKGQDRNDGLSLLKAVCDTLGRAY